MAKKMERKNIHVYADWLSTDTPIIIGILSSTIVRGEEIFSFTYDDNWLKSEHYQQLDPDLQMYKGHQYLDSDKSNFGLFTDSSPDRWGRMLMQRREALIAKRENRLPKKLNESDYLLGVYDENRMGALRFKLNNDAVFLDSNKELAAPPWASLRELENASLKLEDDDGDTVESIKWLNMLIAPGSSLGGARPKASVRDEQNNLWIAKFPSKHDLDNVGGWEMVAYKIAKDAGVSMSQCEAQKFNHNSFTFLTKRFDRIQNKRIHFASALTCLGLKDGDNAATGASYLQLAEFLIRNGANVNDDLEELWRRIVLNICISNVDDHLRNHGFILMKDGWRLSPAYDINPCADGEGLKLNISEHDNSQDLELALSVAEQYRLQQDRAKNIIFQVKASAKKWQIFADEMKISKRGKEMMARAFRFSN